MAQSENPPTLSSQASASSKPRRSRWPGRIGAALGLLLAVAIVGGVIGTVLPRGYSVESSILIDAPPSRVFAKLDSLRAWQEWCPWTDANPGLKGIENSYSGPDAGQGATWSWKHPSGDGKLWINASTRDREVVYDMTFADFPVMHNYIQLEPDGNKTKVLWKSDGQVRSGPLDGWLTMVIPRALRGEYESGLAKLKAVAEAEEKANPTPAGGPGGPGGPGGGFGGGGGFGVGGGGAFPARDPTAPAAENDEPQEEVAPEKNDSPESSGSSEAGPGEGKS